MTNYLFDIFMISSKVLIGFYVLDLFYFFFKEGFFNEKKSLGFESDIFGWYYIWTFWSLVYFWPTFITVNFHGRRGVKKNVKENKEILLSLVSFYLNSSVLVPWYLRKTEKLFHYLPVNFQTFSKDFWLY